MVARATAAADELSEREIIAGGRALEAKVRAVAPRFLAVLGIGAYRTAFARPKATIGLQPDPIGETRVWVLPNPSGLNAHYQGKDLVKVFRALRTQSRSLAPRPEPVIFSTPVSIGKGRDSRSEVAYFVWPFSRHSISTRSVMSRATAKIMPSSGIGFASHSNHR